MAARLYVGNLPYSVTEDGLRQLFSQAGTVVSTALPVDRITGRPRGFGFVEMESNADAEEAVRKFDGYELDNRSIRVQIAREREARTPGYRPSTGYRPSPGRGMGYGSGERRDWGRPEGHRGRGRAA